MPRNGTETCRTCGELDCRSDEEWTDGECAFLPEPRALIRDEEYEDWLDARDEEFEAERLAGW